MTLRDALREGSGRLGARGIETPYLDSVLLLALTLGVRKERVYTDLDETLAAADEHTFLDFIGRRAGGIPVSYLTRSKEFYGRRFYVDERVLVPRPDTETLIDAALDLIDRHSAIVRVHDLGTGSGCIALTLAAERKHLVVTASDLSAGAREVFTLNAERLGLTVTVSGGSYFDEISPPVDLLVSNPPYLTDSEVDAMVAAGWPEPEIALRGGPEGTASLRTIVDGAGDVLAKRGFILLETAPTQTEWLSAYLKTSGFTDTEIHFDLAGRARCISAAIAAHA